MFSDIDIYNTFQHTGQLSQVSPSSETLLDVTMHHFNGHVLIYLSSCREMSLWSFMLLFYPMTAYESQTKSRGEEQVDAGGQARTLSTPPFLLGQKMSIALLNTPSVDFERFPGQHIWCEHLFKSPWRTKTVSAGHWRAQEWVMLESSVILCWHAESVTVTGDIVLPTQHDWMGFFYDEN